MQCGAGHFPRLSQVFCRLGGSCQKKGALLRTKGAEKNAAGAPLDEKGARNRKRGVPEKSPGAAENKKGAHSHHPGRHFLKKGPPSFFNTALKKTAPGLQNAFSRTAR